MFIINELLPVALITKKPNFMPNAGNIPSYLLAKYLEDETLLLRINNTIRQMMEKNIKVRPYITDDNRAYFAVMINGKEIQPQVLPRSILTLITYTIAIHTCDEGFIAIDDADAYLDTETIIGLTKQANKNTQIFLIIRNKDKAEKITEELEAKLITTNPY